MEDDWEKKKREIAEEEEKEKLELEKFREEKLKARGGTSQMSFWEAEGKAKYFL